MNSRFESSVDLSDLKSSTWISLQGSTFSSKLNMNGIDIGGGLFMRKGAEFSEVDLRNAYINHLDMDSSKFKDKLDMNSIDVGDSLHMSGGAEFSEVVLGNAHINKQLDMSGSKFKDKLDMNNIEVGDGLFMRGGAEFSVVVIRNARIKYLDMKSSKFKGELDMNSINVGSLYMREGATFAEVDLRGAKIENDLDMSSSKFTNRVLLNDTEVNGLLILSDSTFNSSLEGDKLKVGSGMYMNGKAEFGDVILASAKIGGILNMGGSKFNDKLYMSGLEVEGGLLMYEITMTTSAPVSLSFAKIGKILTLYGGTLPSFDLTNTSIRGEFRLGKTRWQKDAVLILRNTEVGALNDLDETWPEKLELTGFTYSSLGGPFNLSHGGPFTDTTNEMAKRDVPWFKEWLKKQKRYSPQPYEQLASVLEKAGYKEKAKEIFYAGRERERSQATGLNWIWLTLLNYAIGYGYRFKYALYWSILWIIVVCWCS